MLHPNFYKLLDKTVNDKIYTFNQFYRLKGNNTSGILTARVIIPFNLCKNIK